MNFTDFLFDNSDQLTTEVIEQVEVVGLAILVAALIGIVVGMVSYRRQVSGALAIAVVGTLFTIPSLALLAFLVAPLGLGFLPTLLALILYGLLPVVRNTVVGLRGVDPPIVDSARGLGMGPARILFTIELPVAWPVIMAGVRVTAPILMGIVAIAAYVHGPGLGNEIFTGLDNIGGVNALNQVLAGTAGTVVLALLFDLVLVIISRLTVSKGVNA
jgi:osmoprotectant transport system permease protein